MKYIVPLKGPSLSNDEIPLITHDSTYGVILYGRNLLGKLSIIKLIGDIKRENPKLKTCVDEEGGLVSRIQHLFPNYSQPYVATLNNREVADYYQKRSKFLKELGFDVVLAPVVDLAMDEKSIMYKRSYGNNVDKIIELACLCINAQRKSGLQSCIKHFPGIERTAVDSHEKLPSIDLDFDEWKSCEGLVFKKIIEFGVENVMVGHVRYPKINDNISSLSKY